MLKSLTRIKIRNLPYLHLDMHPAIRLFVLLLLLVGGNILAVLMIVMTGLALGYEVTTLMESLLSGDTIWSVDLLRAFLWIQAIAVFMIPGAVYLGIFYRRRWKDYLRIRKGPATLTVVIALVALIAGYPLVHLAYEVNAAIPLPSWMYSMEDNAARILSQVLAMETFAGFLHVLLLVAILPGIGEELIFRGILQQQVSEWTGRPVVAVWLTAIIFSGIHMQFEGFLPRVVLGAILGFLFLWTRNLWVPIIVHAFNNGVQVAVLYFSDVDLSQIDGGQDMPLNAGVIVISIAVLYGCSVLLRKFQHR